MSSIGNYKGIAITGGTDADVSAQIAKIDSGATAPAYTASAPDIKTATPTTYTKPTQTPADYYSSITAGATSQYTPEAVQAQADAKAAQDKADSQSKLVEAKIAELSGINDFKTGLEKTADISGQQGHVDELTAQLKQLAVESQASKLQYDSQVSALAKPGVVSGVISNQSAELARQQADIERPRAIQSLTLSAQLDAAQGKLATAQTKITDAVNLKYKTMTDEVTNREKLLDDLSANATKKEQRVLDIQKQYLDSQKEAMAIEKSQTTAVLNKVLDAGASGAPLTITQKARELALAGKNDQAVALIAPYVKGSTDTTPKTTQTEFQQKNQAYSDINKLLTLKNSSGVPYTDTQGYFTVQGFKDIIQAAAADGISRSDFLAQYADHISPYSPKNYGLTPAELTKLGYAQ